MKHKNVLGFFLVPFCSLQVCNIFSAILICYIFRTLDLFGEGGNRPQLEAVILERSIGVLLPGVLMSRSQSIVQ